jgi:hypothetical protein
VDLTSNRNPSKEAVLLLHDFEDLLKALVERFPDAPAYTGRVLQAWNGRLSAVAEDVPGYRLSADVSAAYLELKAAAEQRATADTVCEWIDLLGRSALELIDIQADAELVDVQVAADWSVAFCGSIELPATYDELWSWASVQTGKHVAETPALSAAA